MRGNSLPTGATPPVNSWTRGAGRYSAPVWTAPALLAEAGYPDGFTITLDTPTTAM